MSDRQVQLITLRGEQLRIVPSFAALEKIELATGKGALHLLKEMGNGQYKLSDLATILYATCQPMSDRLPEWWTRQDVGQAMIDAGAQHAFVVVIAALTDAVTAKPSVTLPKSDDAADPKP